MSKMCTVVTYHFIRDFIRSRFPRINGLDLSSFREQLLYMQSFYTFVTVNECIEAIYGTNKLPNNAALLTFDDGYIEHFTHVFPVLDSMGIQGCFFPTVCAIKDHRVLDVNKIHFIIASSRNTHQLKLDVFDALDHLRSEGHEIESNNFLYEKLAISDEFNYPHIIFLKRLLQRELPEKLRSFMINNLFENYVTDDESTFSQELYMSEDQICMMIRHGMAVGCHGYEHRWMEMLSSSEQKIEIERSLDFMKSVGVHMENWQMCYPYGSHNESLRNICQEMGCGMAFTIDVGIAKLSKENSLLLPRLDTNHLPIKSNAQPNYWTKKACQ